MNTFAPFFWTTSLYLIITSTYNSQHDIKPNYQPGMLLLFFFLVQSSFELTKPEKEGNRDIEIQKQSSERLARIAVLIKDEDIAGLKQNKD